jgi:hypothetical protein
VALFVVFRVLERRAPRSVPERLANVADSLPDLLVRQAPTQYRQARELLRPISPRDARTRALDDLLELVRPAALSDAASTSLAARALRCYERWIASAWFRRGIVVLFGATALGNFLLLALLLLVIGAVTIGGVAPEALAEAGGTSESEWIAVVMVSLGSVLGLGCTIAGVRALGTSHRAAWRWFQRSIVASLLLVQPVTFFTDSFGALSSLAVNLVLWSGLGYLAAQEAAREAQLPTTSTPASS